MDPHSSADFISQMVLANIYDPLIQRDRELKLEYVMKKCRSMAIIVDMKGIMDLVDDHLKQMSNDTDDA